MEGKPHAGRQCNGGDCWHAYVCSPPPPARPPVGQGEHLQLLNKLILESARLKVPLVEKFLTESLLVEGGPKFLIFAHHKELLNGIEHACNKEKVGGGAGGGHLKELLNGIEHACNKGKWWGQKGRW